MDVFWISETGVIWGNWWDDQVSRGAWQTPVSVSLTAPPPSGSSGGLTAKAPPIKVGGIGHAAQNLSPGLDPTASPDSGIAAVARTPYHIDVFWIGNDGQVWFNWSDSPANRVAWNTPLRISLAAPAPPASNCALIPAGGGNQGLQAPPARPNSPVTAVARTPEHLDVFWIGKDGSIWSNWWDDRRNRGAWNAPFPISGPNSAAPNSGLSAVTRTPEHLDVFWTAPDGNPMSNWCDSRFNAGRWNVPFRVLP
jgi:hypothetical protein